MPISERKQTAAIDVELAGDILRVAHSGLPELASSNTSDALLELRSNHEAFRDFLNLPPNGNPLINSCLLYPPFEHGTNGAFFLASRFAYAPYAGTALMAAATVVADSQDQALAADQQLVVLETARGVMEVQLVRRNGIVTQAKWATAAPKLLISNEKLHMPLGGDIQVSLVDAGLPYLVVDTDTLGIALDDRPKLADTAIELSIVAGKQFPMSRFGIGGSYGQYLIMFTSKAADHHVKTVWVSDKGEVANSAGGTGALSVLAACEGDGLVPLGRHVVRQAGAGTRDRFFGV